MNEFGTEDLQKRIDQEIQLAKHIGIVVESADDTTGWCCARRWRPTAITRALPSAAACIGGGVERLGLVDTLPRHARITRMR